MKVCFLVGTLGRGGAERQLLFMLKALKECNIDSRILCLTKGESYEEEIKSLGVPIEWVGKSKNRGVRLLTIINNLRKNPANILQSSHFYTNIYVGIAGKLLKIPSIGAVRSDLLSEIKFHGFLGKWQVALPHFLIVNSRLAYQRAVELGVSSQNVQFVRNVVETNRCEAKDLFKSDSHINILFVGRLDRNKRPERFIKLAAVLIEKFPEIPLQFQIAGDGVMRDELESLTRELSLNSGIMKFLGVCSDMRAVYRQADILISTSEREGTSNVILEAMAHKLPVIATKVGGTSDILNDKRGILIEPANESQLIESATKLILNKSLRRQFGLEGRNYVEKQHSIEGLQHHLHDIYKNLTERFN